MYDFDNCGLYARNRNTVKKREESMSKQEKMVRHEEICNGHLGAIESRNNHIFPVQSKINASAFNSSAYVKKNGLDNPTTTDKYTPIVSQHNVNDLQDLAPLPPDGGYG